MLSQVVLSLVLPVPMIALLVLAGPARRDGQLSRCAAGPGCGAVVAAVRGAGAQPGVCCCRPSACRSFRVTAIRCDDWPTWPIARDGRAQHAGCCRPSRPRRSRFGKARTAQSGALLEDYVELISDLLASNGEARPTDIARRLGVSHATAIKTIGRLKREGLAVAKPYRGVFLTEARRAAGRPGARAPPLVVDLLLAVGVPAEAAEQDAEGSSTTCPTRPWRRSRGS